MGALGRPNKDRKGDVEARLLELTRDNKSEEEAEQILRQEQESLFQGKMLSC